MSLVRPGFASAWTVLRHAGGMDPAPSHNGHNVKSWLLALGCGLAGQFRGGCILTLHSGMVSGYLETSPGWRRKLAALTAPLYPGDLCRPRRLAAPFWGSVWSRRFCRPS